MESEVFLLGHWKNYDELESNLSMEELIVTINAIRDKDSRDRKFFAALQGIDLDENNDEQDDENDITKLRGWKAAEEGFGIGLGIGHVQVGI